MSRARLARVHAPAALVAALVLLGGCSPEGRSGAPEAAAPADPPPASRSEPAAAPPSGAGSEVLASVGEREITQAELDQRIREQLFERMVASQGPARLKQYRERALEDMIDELVLAREARRRGLTPEALLAGERREVRDEQVEEFFTRHRDRYGPDARLEDHFAEIRQLLLEQRRQEVLAGLRARESLKVQSPSTADSVDRDGFVIGPESAPVTLVAFVDYLSTSYRRTQPVLDTLVTRYPSELRVRMRQLPDARDPRARAASAAAICAAEQGRFPAYHALLLANPRELADEDLERYAIETGLDPGSFTACAASPATGARIDEDVRAAHGVGIEVAPGFWLNGQVVPGPRPVDVFERLVEAHLRRAAQAGPPGTAW